MQVIVLFLLGMVVGVVWSMGLVLLVLLIYFRKTAEIGQFIESQLQNRGTAQFIDSVSPEEKIDNLFNINQK